MNHVEDVKLLVLSDDDMNCKSDNIESMSLSDVGFSALVTSRFDIIVYSGKKGTKVLKSKYFSKGIIESTVKKELP